MEQHTSEPTAALPTISSYATRHHGWNVRASLAGGKAAQDAEKIATLESAPSLRTLGTFARNPSSESASTNVAACPGVEHGVVMRRSVKITSTPLAPPGDFA